MHGESKLLEINYCFFKKKKTHPYVIQAEMEKRTKKRRENPVGHVTSRATVWLDDINVLTNNDQPGPDWSNQG